MSGKKSFQHVSGSILTFVQQLSVVLVTVNLTSISECTWVAIALYGIKQTFTI